MRVIIPTNADELITLISNIIKKETALGASSNLTPAELAELQVLLDKAIAANNSQKELYKQAEVQTAARDNALGTSKGTSVNQPGNAKYTVTSLRDVLLAKNKTNPKVLGDWGFDVVDEAAPKPPKKAL